MNIIAIIILIILIRFGMKEKMPFFFKYTLLSLMFLNNFPFMCQNIFECAQLMNFIASIMEPKHMCFDVLDFQGQSLFQ